MRDEREVRKLLEALKKLRHDRSTGGNIFAWAWYGRTIWLVEWILGERERPPVWEVSLNE